MSVFTECAIFGFVPTSHTARQYPSNSVLTSQTPRVVALLHLQILAHARHTREEPSSLVHETVRYIDSLLHDIIIAHEDHANKHSRM